MSLGTDTRQVPIPTHGHTAGLHQAPGHLLGCSCSRPRWGRESWQQASTARPLSAHLTSDARRTEPRARSRAGTVPQGPGKRSVRRGTGIVVPAGCLTALLSPALCPVMSWANFSTLSGASLPISHLLSGRAAASNLLPMATRDTWRGRASATGVLFAAKMEALMCSLCWWML